MKQEMAQDIALMRYSTIAPLVAGLPEEHPSLEAYFRSVSEKGVMHPEGKLVHPTPATLKRWYYNYRKRGFDALLPEGRSDAGSFRRIDADLEERIRYFKETYPRMSAAAIYRQLCSDGTVSENDLSESTVNRYINAMTVRERKTNNRDMRRYERPHVNEVWCGNCSVGLTLRRRMAGNARST